MTPLFAFQAALGALLAAVLLRAQWRRRENALLATVCVIDAGHAATSALLLGSGYSPTGELPMQVSLISRILVVMPLLEFSYAFPSGDRPPRWMRVLGASATVMATFAALVPTTSGWIDHWIGRSLFFLPFFLATLRGVRQNLRQMKHGADGHGARLLLVAAVLLSTEALLVYVGIRELWPRLFPLARTFDAVVTLSGYAVLAYAVLAHQAFRVRGVVAEALVYGAFGACFLALIVTAAELTAEKVTQRAVRGLAFTLLVLVPTAAWILIERYAPRFEHAVLSPFDPRRRLLKSALQRVLQESVEMVDATALCELTRNAIEQLSGGRALLWAIQLEPAGDGKPKLAERILPAALAERLRRETATTLRRHGARELREAGREICETLQAEALVVVRSPDKLWCAISVHGATLHQDSLDTFEALAANLGSKLAHHAMYERAFELQAQLDTSNRLATLGSFAAAVAHDIRTPLTSAKMNLEIIRSQPDLSPDLAECADIALEALRRMNDYVSAMLDYLKPVQLRAVEFDARALLEETARIMQPLLESRRLLLRCEAQGDTPLPALRADVSRLKQVLVNLVENAADASEPGQVIHLSVAGDEPGQLAICVRDQGHGIQPANLERIFDPFFTMREGGTGLGLAIVRKLVRAHGGDVHVQSTPMQGSTFTVVLPVWNAALSAYSYV